MRRLALAVALLASCTSAGEKNTPAAAPASGDLVPGTSVPAPSAPADTAPSAAPASATTQAAPAEDPAVIEKRQVEAVAKYQVRAADREKLRDAFGSAIIQLALVRKNGGRVDDKVVAGLWNRLKHGVCFSEPKLNIVDRTKKKPAPSIIEPMRIAATGKMQALRATCPAGKQPLVMSIRLDSFDEEETKGAEKAKGVSKKGGAETPFEYDTETLERVVSAVGEVAIESRVFPFKVSERSRDRGHGEITTPSGAKVAADPLDVRPMAELDQAISDRIVAVVQQALDRHMEGLRHAYTNMAVQTNTLDDGASQEHHALELVALGGRLDESQALAEKLSARYDMPASELAAAVAALHLD